MPSYCECGCEPPVPLGTCHCGCGAKTPLARQSIARTGAVRGQPLRYLLGHNSKKFAPGYEIAAKPIPGMETPCWIWTGRIDPDGYGRLGRNSLAHVAEWTKKNGPPPAGRLLHHVCENPPCVNPDHLSLETRASHRGRHGKITRALAEAVRSAEGSQREIGARHGLSQYAVWRILHGYDGPDNLDQA